MKWARIKDGLVAETTTEAPDGRYPEALRFVPCGDEVEEGFRCGEDGVFRRPSAVRRTAAAPADKRTLYGERCRAAIAAEYPPEDEIKLLRRALAQLAETGELPEEFIEYHDYAELCLCQAEARIYGENSR